LAVAKRGLRGRDYFVPVRGKQGEDIMKKSALIIGSSLAAIATAALAPDITRAQNAPPQNLQSSPQNQTTIRQQVQKNLQDAGFSDINIMPSSFLVRAKDKSGNPVMMVINPDSITTLTQTPNNQ
jgi:hypothetical protein